MPTININETDKTLYGLNENTTDNIVFVPGSAITGPSESPVLVTSYVSFVDQFGSYGPEGSPTWNYVAGLLLAGFPVLFKRIIPSDAQFAQLSEDNQNTLKLNVKAKYAGTYGNGLSFKIWNNNAGAILGTVYRGNKIVESVVLFRTKADSTAEDITAGIKSTLDNTNKSEVFSSVDVELQDGYEFNNDAMTEAIALENGSDGSESDVIDAIATAVTVEDFGTSPFGDISDKYVFDVKYVTSGGYTSADKDKNLSIARAIDALCNYRKDCFGIPDIPYGIEPEDVNTWFNDLDSTYCAAYAPWYLTKLDTGTQEWMPPSFVFLTALADSLKNENPIWYPPAGVSRMRVTRAIKPEYEIGGALMNKWQSEETQAINPIMKVRGYGYCVYGQRTLYVPTTTTNSALSAVNVRLTANEIKRRIFNVCIGLTFEQNITYTWNKFVSNVEPLLISMKSDNGLYDFQIIMNRSTISADDINNKRAVGVVRVSIVNAIEHFDIGFELEPYGVTFTSEIETTL